MITEITIALQPWFAIKVVKIAFVIKQIKQILQIKSNATEILLYWIRVNCKNQV